MAANTVQQKVETVRVTDLELAQQAAGGDPSAFEAFMRRHNPALYRTARSITPYDAEVAVQGGHPRAYQDLSTVRAQSSVATWLTGVVNSRALERLRKRKQQTGTVAIDNVIDLEAHIYMAYKGRRAVETPMRAAMRKQMSRLLEQRIDELPVALRTVFVMRAVEEMSVDESAACLGLPEATVRTRFLRARRLLRKSLAEDVSSTLGVFACNDERSDRIVRIVLARIAGST